ncbi:MAG: hypothetical protein IJD97_01310 [Clostridia bacterium]|nr:hypothetical protein [Clostridia bacterium]
MKMLRMVSKVLIWTILYILPIALLAVSLVASTGDEVDNFGMLAIILFFFNPLYAALISYCFINKISVAFMYICEVIPWLLLCLRYLARTNDDWLMIAELEFSAGIYQIIGITICFAVACLVKYLLYRRKAKKAQRGAETVE